MTIAQAVTPTLVWPGEAAVYDQMQGEKIHILLAAERTGGAMTLFIDEVPPGAGPPLHIHHNEDETFYVLQGELVMEVDGERTTVKAGSTAFLPRDVPHAFANLSEQTVRTLVVVTPGGLEHFFAEVEPLAMQEEPEMSAILAVAAEHGVEVVGPPLTASDDNIPAQAGGNDGHDD